MNGRQSFLCSAVSEFLVPVRMLCICSPSGQEEFFRGVGVPVATRTSPPPKLDEAAEAEFRQKAAALALKYRTELLERA
jgi:hypothetical protein